MTKIQLAFGQIKYLAAELNIIVHGNWWRWFTCWFSGGAGVLISYRLDRFFYLLFGKLWPILRILFLPIFIFLRLLSANHQIHYAANIGKGLQILHPSLGIVVSGKTIAGQKLILTGGNCIGGRKTLNEGELVLGDHVSLGANAVILGPITIGNDVSIGAGAVVIHSAPDGVVLAGVPATIIKYAIRE